MGTLATAALLGVVSATAGLGAAGWIIGLATGSAAAALLVAARMRSDQPVIFPADWVTLTRAVLIAGVTGLVADSFGRRVSTTALVTLSSRRAGPRRGRRAGGRRTGTATPLGARIDGEADAFLILVLSIAVSQDYGAWVLVIGAARYALLLAGWDPVAGARRCRPGSGARSWPRSRASCSPWLPPGCPAAWPG